MPAQPPASVPAMSGMPPTALESQQNLATLQRLSYLRIQAQHRELTEVEQEELAEEAACIHCGGFHARACPRVKRIAFHPNGKVSEVEYWSAAEVDWHGVVFNDGTSVEGDEDMIGVPVRLALKLISGIATDRREAMTQLTHLVDLHAEVTAG